MRIIDVEGDWRFTHQDLGARSALAGGSPAGDVERRNHGTNVLGMLIGVHDARGVDGICPEAAVRAVSYQPEDRWGSARAIAYAAGELRPGDILLVEMQRPGPRADLDDDGQDGYLPMSYWPDDLTAMQYAAGRGVIVVEAAGNGAEHLDDAIFAGPGPGFRPQRPNPFARDGLDSGSILVGAGAPPGGRRGPDRSRLRFSNWGSALDAQGWGRDVATTGGVGPGADTARPGDDEDAWYTDAFAGTSSAAPMVAGALACVQGVLRAAGREPLTPAQARAALRETGSPQQAAEDGSLEPIGNRPDISQLIDWAMDATRPARPTTPRPRRSPRMKVTITIEDDGNGGIEWGGAPRARTSGAPTSAGRTSAGPHIVHPARGRHGDRRSTIAGLKAAAAERGDSPRPVRRAHAVRDLGGLGAVGHAELAEDVGDVQARGLGADEQPLGDLPVRQPLADQLEHLGLAGGQAERGQRRRIALAALRRRGAERHARAPGERLELRAHQLGAERRRLLVRGAQRVGARRGRPRRGAPPPRGASPRRPPDRARRSPPRRSATARPHAARSPRRRPARPRRAPPALCASADGGLALPVTQRLELGDQPVGGRDGALAPAASAGGRERRLGLHPRPHREQRRRVEQLARRRRIAARPLPTSAARGCRTGPATARARRARRRHRGHVLGRRALAAAPRRRAARARPPRSARAPGAAGRRPAPRAIAFHGSRSRSSSSARRASASSQRPSRNSSVAALSARKRPKEACMPSRRAWRSPSRVTSSAPSKSPSSRSDSAR